MNDAQEKLAAQLQALRESYAAQLPEKIGQIDALWEGLQKHWDDENFRTLHRQVHGLTGSGATFGFVRLSEVARALEIFLKGLMNDEGGSVPSDAQRDEVAQYLKALKKSVLNADARKPMAQAQTELPPPGTPYCDASNRLVFLVDDDAPFAQSLALQIGYFGYSVQVFATLKDAYRAIIQSPPAVLLLDIGFPEDRLGGIALLEQINREIGRVLPACFISAHGDLEHRLKAVRAGGCAYFTKPLETANLVDRLEAMTTPTREEPYRILIVDDSASLSDYYATVLKGAGMMTETVTDPLRVMEPLLEFAPDLILMDVYMPQCSGLELATVIRQQERFVSVPIVYLSAETDLDKQLVAMNLGGDDFLTKPIQPAHLISSVSARVQRSRVLRSFMVRDSLTGLLNHTTTKTQLDMQLARVKRLGGKLAFAMLDIDLFKRVNDTYGHPTGDRVIRSLSRLLQQRLRTSDVVGRYGGEEFAVIFNDTHGADALQVLDSIRHDFSLIRHQHEKGEFSTTFSAGIADFPTFDDSAAINEAADKALYAAKNGGRNQVVLGRR